MKTTLAEQKAASGQRRWRVRPLATQIVCLCLSLCYINRREQSDVDGINYCLRISGVVGYESSHQVLSHTDMSLVATVLIGTMKPKLRVHIAAIFIINISQ
jgi:hypothetical protein